MDLILACADGVQVRIKAKSIKHSPYLDTIINTKFHTQLQEGNVYPISWPSKAARAYRDYISGDRFKPEDADPEMFQFMGHENPYNHPLDLWIQRLHGSRMRHLISKTNSNTCPKGHEGLVQVSLKKRWMELGLLGYMPAGLYITGRCLLYYAGLVDEAPNKIQLAATSIEAIHTLFRDLIDANSASLSETQDSIILKYRERYHGLQARGLHMHLCISKHIHKSMTSIAYSHEIDCKGLVLEPAKGQGTPILWATTEASYAIKNRINVMDPDRPIQDKAKWVYSMSCMVQDGFDIGLTGIKDENIRWPRIEAMLEDIAKSLRMPTCWAKDDRGRIALAASYNARDHNHHLVPQDPASTLILASILWLHHNIVFIRHDTPVAYDLEAWLKVQFNPSIDASPLGPPKAWWSQSPLYQ